MKIDLQSMQLLAHDAAELLKLLANQHRLMILCVLIEGEKSVGQLVELVGARDSTVSQNLAVLRRCGVISGRRDGRTIHYRLESKAVRGVLESLCASLCEPAQAPPRSRPLPQAHHVDCSSASITVLLKALSCFHPSFNAGR